jgi:hypothetical protein
MLWRYSCCSFRAAKRCCFPALVSLFYSACCTTHAHAQMRFPAAHCFETLFPTSQDEATYTRVKTEGLPQLHQMLLDAFGCPQYVLRIMLASADLYPAPDCFVVDIRAQRRPERTRGQPFAAFSCCEPLPAATLSHIITVPRAEFLQGVVDRLDVFLKSAGPFRDLCVAEDPDGEPLDPIIRLELCNAEDVVDNYC